MKIKKAVITAAGYGTRFLPATKSLSKEMIPLIDKPIIQYIVEELVASGIEDIIMVIRGSNFNLGNHFDSSAEIEEHLEKNKKYAKLEEIKSISNLANIVYIRQTNRLPYGNGTPLLFAKDFIDKDEAFAYIYADDLVLSDKPALLQLIEKYEQVNAPVMACQSVSRDQVNKYGIISLKENSHDKVAALIEKPSIDEAPSTLASYGRYILDHSVIDKILKLRTGKDGELWLADALNSLAQETDVYCVPVEGEWLTTGDPLNYMQAMIKYALKREDLREPLLEFIKNVKE